jgi:alkanesulfonate monooxygenase SsuD/methylene tetrahydromethanopterin reductase-like flavin-dependent oxidoreductase (luciferase family)
VTWRLAAKFADELNVDGMLPEDVAEALPVIRSRCEEIDRDPSSLRVSVHVWGQLLPAGSQRVERLAAYQDLGVDRVMTLVKSSATDDEALESLAQDARQAGVVLA